MGRTIIENSETFKSHSVRRNSKISLHSRKASILSQTEELSTKRNLFKLFSAKQWKILVVLGLTNTIRGALNGCGGPFYPPLAKSRGLSDSEIGFVFASLGFSAFGVCLILGKYIIPKFGPRCVLTFSALSMSICSVLFGCLVFVQDKTSFLILSIVLRVFLGIGEAGKYPSAFCIFAKEFELNVGAAIGIFELAAGVGSILGPLIFGAVIDTIGFLSVHAIIGFLLFCCVVLILTFTPPPVPEEEEEGSYGSHSEIELGINEKSPKWYRIFFLPSILLVLFSIFAASASVAFYISTLGSHIQQFGLSTLHQSAVFIVAYSVYTLLSPVWGSLADNFEGVAKNGIVFVSGGLLVLGFGLIGPIPWLPLQPSLWMTIFGLTIHGVGISGATMSGFPHAIEAAVSGGFRDDEKTHSLISSLYTLIFTLGSIVGGSISGVLVDLFGFRSASCFIIGLGAIVMVSSLCLSVCQLWKTNKKTCNKEKSGTK